MEREVCLQCEEATTRCEQRQWEIERTRLLATLPNEADLAKIQRYEAHISRQFYKALHELQMVQTGRQSLHPSAPLAIDVLDTISSQGE